MMICYSFRKLAFSGVFFALACQSQPEKPMAVEASPKLAATSQQVSAKAVVEQSASPQHTYAWLSAPWEASESLCARIPVPEGYERLPLDSASFGSWLRYLPLAPKGTPVQYHNGTRKPQQHLHEAVIAIDIGSADLQQCADAAMRLRAEYLYSIGAYEAIGFRFTNGEDAPFSKWKAGHKVVIKNNRIAWVPDAKNNVAYPSFRKYMNLIFMYAGTASLEKELPRVAQFSEMKVGDLLLQGGFPGHAVLVADMAVNPITGDKAFLLLQSYMPAQSIHVLKNTYAPSMGAWFSMQACQASDAVYTPQWDFQPKHLSRFK